MTHPSNDRSRPPAPPPIAGLLVIDKPLTMTSMSVCRIVKRRLMDGGQPKRVKVGQAGTLDPLATGVMVILIGRSTHTCEHIMGLTKTYDVLIDLGHTSTSDDMEGDLRRVDVPTPPDAQAIDRVLDTMRGTIQQRPPLYSALQVGGTRAYRLARKGRDIELPARPVVIHSIERRFYEFPMLRLIVKCGRGTYLRSLARDVGLALGTGGMLAGLRRTGVGPFHAKDAVSPTALPIPLLQHHLLIDPWADRGELESSGAVD